MKINRKIKLMNEKIFVINISNKYKNIKQKKFDIYVKKMKAIFQIRFITYETNKQKILFAQKFLKFFFVNNRFNFRKKKTNEFIT